jgi:Gpi18-like mannosyltransferase
MIKKIIILLLITALLGALAFGLFGCAPTRGENLLLGGDFTEFENRTDLVDVWNFQSGAGGSGLTFNTEGGGSARIDTTQAGGGNGWARLTQPIRLSGNSYYKVTLTFRTTRLSAPTTNPADGIFVGFLEDPNFNVRASNAEVHGIEDGEVADSKTLTYYFRSTNMRDVTLAINVGTPDGPVSVSAVNIFNVSLTRVARSEAVNRADGVQLYTLRNTVIGVASDLNTVFVVLGAVGTLVIAYAFYMLRARSKAIELNPNPKQKWFIKLKESKVAPVLTVVGVALLVRLLITLIEAFVAGGTNIREEGLYLGFNMSNNVVWGGFAASHGPNVLYNPPSNLPNIPAVTSLMPLATFAITLAGLFGRMTQALGGSAVQIAVTVATVIKLLAVAADIGVILIIYNIVKNKQGKVAATIMSLGYALMPIAFIFSASFGAIEAISTFFVVLSFSFILRKNYIGMAISYFVAVMFSLNALLAVPFILMYTGMYAVKAIKDRNLKWLAPVVAIGVGVFAYWLISLPLFFAEIQAGYGGAPFNYFVDAAHEPNLYSLNAFNFQALLNNNFARVTTESFVVAILFVVFVLGILGVAYFKSKNRLNLEMFAVAFIIVYWYFLNNMTPASLYVMLPLLYIYTVLSKDKRLYAIFALFAMSIFVNVAYEHMIAGYTASGVNHINRAVVITMSIINMILVFAYVVIGYDCVMAKRSKEHLTLKVPYGEYLKSVFVNLGINFKNLGYKLQAVGKAVTGGAKGKDKVEEEQEAEEQTKPKRKK